MKFTPDAFKEQFADVLAQINILSEGGTKSLVASQLKNKFEMEKASSYSPLANKLGTAAFKGELKSRQEKQAAAALEQKGPTERYTPSANDIPKLKR